LFDAAADYIKELENEIEILKAANAEVTGRRLFACPG
jgi:hypothetical protein